MKSISELKARRTIDRANEGESGKKPAVDNNGDFERLSKEDDID